MGSTVFLLVPFVYQPKFGDKNVGKIEEHFGHHPWFLETPAYSTRNHAFMKNSILQK